MTYYDFWKPLTAVYDEGEARAVARMVLEVRFGLTLTDIVCDRVPTVDETWLKATQQRLLDGEPVQYVLGQADFGPRSFVVGPGVLIPRPETYELCQWVEEVYGQREAPFTVLDIGTGSGCIACTLAADLPRASVTAWDISDDALAVAATNASRTGAKVTLEHHDILRPPADGRQWDVIVSNPPYVCERERAAMERHVADHEPRLALFVPDDDPLRFYRAIGRYARHALRPGGRVFVECNPLYCSQTRAELMREGDCQQSSIRCDQYQKYRFINACKIIRQ